MSVDDPRIKSGEPVHVSAGTIVVREVATGKTFRASKDDPRIKSGELLDIKTGTKWVHRIMDDKIKRMAVPKDELNSYLSSGWSLGRGKVKH